MPLQTVHTSHLQVPYTQSLLLALRPFSVSRSSKKTGKFRSLSYFAFLHLKKDKNMATKIKEMYMHTVL